MVNPVVLLAALLHLASAHTPTGAGTGSRKEPHDLGDPTANSWAITGEMQPNQVFHYKFTIPDAAAASNKGNNRFYLGYYVPGAGEPDFTFYVAVFGMRNSTNCSQWGDGWGRRRRLGGGDDHAHNTAPTTPITAPDSGVITPHRITSSGTAWLMDSNDIPERVSGKNDGHDHDHDGQFNYHKAADTLTFIASPATNRPNKFESFSPTLFKPRGSCIADFPRGGEYRMSVWGEVGQVGAKKFSVGIGLAERDVFAPVNLMTFDYLLFPIQEWNGWNGFVLILPLLLGVLAAIATIMVKRKLRHYDAHTSTGFPTPFRALVLVCSGALLGHLVMNISILAWATRNATIHNGREMMFPLLMGIIMPLLSGSSTLLVGLLPRSCCCCGAKSAAASPGSRCVVGFFGLLHLFGVHAGYVLIPLLLIVAAALPPKLANHGILVGGRVGGGQVHKVAGVDGKEGKGTQEAGDNATKQMTVAATQMTDLA